MSNRSQGNGRGGGMLFSPEDFTPKKSSRQYKRMRDANKSKSKQERLDKWGGKTRWEKTTGMRRTSSGKDLVSLTLRRELAPLSSPPTAAAAAATPVRRAP
eukprot:CAMPEP_0194591736 /NCGR_PEP_ID=MMETSP0292-20121207/22277_1 /TAXON_ID=39354 /ORGANISM="Heterosigma akashiwo, Strain CCMP2393" /LENGTH=100 /DNA_ID=CAMNT_0039449935 /DNA_START=231 /DNA_END=530 /DNA_ORIENTATION=-